MGEVRSLNLWLALSRCGDVAPGLDIVPRRLDEFVGHRRPTRRCSRYQVSQRKAEEAAGDTPIVRPVFEPGDALFFDELFLHQTGVRPVDAEPALRDRELVLRRVGVPRASSPRSPSRCRSRPVTATTRIAGASSLAQSAELMLPCLDAAGARSVVEVGAFAGDLTRRARRLGGRRGRARRRRRPVAAGRRSWRSPSERPELELVRETSLEALPRDPAARRRDHRRRPQLLHGQRGAAADRRARAGRRAAAAAVPRRLLAARPPRRLLRRRADPGGLPAAAGGRRAAASSPASPGCAPAGCPTRARPRARAAPRNGVLTAVEDFVGEPRAACGSRRAGVLRLRRRLARATRRGRTRSAAILDPWDRNPLLERLEANRVHHLAQAHVRLARAVGEQRAARRARRRCCGGCSSRAPSRSPSGCRGCASAPASRPSTSVVSKEEIRRVLEGD